MKVYVVYKQLGIYSNSGIHTETVDKIFSNRDKAIDYLIEEWNFDCSNSRHRKIADRAVIEFKVE